MSNRYLDFLHMRLFNILSIILIILVLAIIYSSIILTPGNLASGDLTFPLFLKNFISDHIFIWSDSFGWNTYDLVPRLIYNLPFIIFGIIFDLDISTISKILIFFTAVLSSISFFMLSKFLLRDLKYSKNIIAIASICGSIIYGINIWVIIRTGHFYYLPTYAIIPVILLILIKYDKDKSNYIKYSLMIGILIAIFGISPHGIFWIMSIIISWLLFISLFSRFDYKCLYQNIKFLISIILFSLVMSSYFVIPMLISPNVAPSYMMSQNVFEMLSRNSDPDKVIRLLSEWWHQGNYYPDQNYLLDIWSMTSFILPLMAAMSIILNRNRYTIYLSVLTLIFILFSLGTKTYISKIFYDIFLSFLGSFMWIFRDPAKNLSVIALSYSILAGITISEILTRIRKLQAIFIIFVFLMSYGFFIAPTIDRYMFDIYVPTKIPEEYFMINNQIGNQTDDFKVLWLSSWNYGVIIDGTHRYSWDKNKATSSQMTVGSSKKSSFDKGKSNNFKYYSTYLNNIMFENIDIKKYLSPLSIKYIIYTNDGYGGEDKGDQDIKILNRYLNKTLNYGFIYEFENQPFSPYINIVNNIALLGGIDKFTSLNNIYSFDPINTSLFFLDQDQNYKNRKYEYIKNSDYLILDNNKDNFLTTLVDDKFFIKPLDSTIYHDPYKLWSKASITDPLHGPFRPYLDKFGIENWDFDYGKGLVFTQSNLIIDKNANPSKEELLYSYNFENSFEGWDINEKNIHSMILSGESYSGKFGLQTTLNESKWGWKTINSPLIPTHYEKQYRWTFYIKGENSYEVHAKIMEYDINKNIINTDYVTYIGKEIFDWKEISFDYILSDNNTKYIQLQIWYGHETDQPIPNKIWIDDVKVYNMTKYVKPVVLDMDVNINNDDDYELFVRYFKNEKGCRINISLDGKLINSINTYDQLNKFEWKKVDTLKLKKGKYKLTLTNVEGFNAVNIFALIPKKEYEEMQEKTDLLLEGKRLIYTFEAESDLYRDNTSISEKYGGNASNGKVLEFNETSVAWQTVDILRSDNYKMALKINGSFDVKVDDIIYNVSSNMSDFVYIGPMYLNKGNHKIEIQGNNSDLDVIWLYSVNNINKKIESRIISNTTIPIIKPTGREIAIKTDKRRGFIPINQSPGNIIEINEGDNVTWFNEEVIPVTFISDIPEFGVKFLDYGKRISYMFARQGSYHFYFKENKNFNVTVVVKSLYDILDNDTNVDPFIGNSEKLEDIFTVKEIPATITNYTKINPTLYNTKINATKPFMISFAESYDPLWTAKVDRINGKTVNSEVIRPIPLYSVVNGFWINQTGDLDITIEYEPQRWFYIGAAISITALIICIGYLIYDWRRKRNE